jgi:hydroxymethylpyrimidine pyrophosphatase-like HAD family hydrolase
VVASGNQLSTLKNYFPEIAHQIAFVSENGAYVMDAEQEVSFAHFSSDLVERMRTQISERYASSLILCGKQGAYIGHAVPQQNLEKLNKYFKSLQQLPDLAQVQDHICKVTLIPEIIILLNSVKTCNGVTLLQMVRSKWCRVVLALLT